jgi:hypothetical protein
MWKAFRSSLDFHSCAIEGNKLSQSDTHRVLDAVDDMGNSFDQQLNQLLGMSEETYDTQTIDGDQYLLRKLSDLPANDVLEIAHHDAALTFARKTMLGKPLTTANIISLSRLVIPPPPPPTTATSGRPLKFEFPHLEADHAYRRWVVRVSGSPTVRPYPHEVPALMNRLLALHQQQVHACTMHPTVRCVAFSMNFLHIHPFSDGNGRTARLLLNVLLHNAGYFGCVFKVSTRRQYMACFQDYHDSGILDPMVQLLLSSINGHLINPLVHHRVVPE